MSVEMSVKVPVEMSVEVPVETPVTIFIAEVTELKEPERKRFFGKSSHGLWKQARSRNPELLQRQEEETNVLPQEAHCMELEVTKEIFCMVNKEDARDGILSIKEWMRTMREDDGETRKFEPMPLMKQVWNGQQFAWKYCGKKHETAEALGAALQSSPLFTEDGTADIICKVYSQGEKAMDFMYKDAEIVAMARDNPETHGGKTQSEYFTNGSHPSLEKTKRF